MPSSENGVEEEVSAVEPVVKTVDRGAVKLTVKADKDRITIAERVALNIEVEADADLEVEMPQFGAEMNEFQIRAFSELYTDLLSQPEPHTLTGRHSPMPEAFR